MIPFPERRTGLTRGPFPLDEATIAREVLADAAGVFVLGYETRYLGELAVRFVGRADADLRGALRGFIGTYSDFKFEPVSDTVRAFALECDIYHSFEPAGNDTHPKPPAGGPAECPVPACFEL